MGESVIRREIQIEARTEKLDELLDILRADMEEMGCPMDKQTTVEICAEEIFVNIASYAYGESVGDAYIEEEIGKNSVTVCFRDKGMPYNPLEKEDPDTSLSADERQIGGLGIFMVKSMMDSVSYEYKEGANCLTMMMAW
ncbi:MAG: ATP-binding protein [Lachnospiraceae bacterium]|nr:ATP-binding protein [Lachnospiraceae bacterium]